MKLTPRQLLKTTTLALLIPFLLGAAQASEPREPRIAEQVSSIDDAKEQNSAESKQPKEKPLPFTVDTMNA